MSRSKRVVAAFLNSAEDYFHDKTIIEDGSKLCKPCEPDYKEVRDLTKWDYELIVSYALSLLDEKLYAIIPSAALNAALQMSIHSLNNGQFQSKIDAKTYETLLNVLTLKNQQSGK
jgi:hypothetical protein